MEKTLPLYLNHSAIQHVVVCDETGEDIEAICASGWNRHPKLTLHRNPKRLGIYYNKRKCIEVSPTEWVAVLDSDNFFNDTFFNTLQNIWKKEGAHSNHFYACGNGLFINEQKEVSNPLSGFGGTKLTKDTWNAFLEKPKWNYMLNDGNWVVHRSVLDTLPTDVRDEDILATDAMFMARQFVKNGYTYNIREELTYIHPIHSESSWILQGDENMRIWTTTNWKL